nr:hypothetical protein [Mammaliicoccus sp. Marseille-Q6498]
MAKIVNVELMDIEAFITGDKCGRSKSLDISVPSDLELIDLSKDLHQVFDKSLNKASEFMNSIFINAFVKNEKKDNHIFTVLKCCNDEFNYSARRIEDIAIYLDDKYRCA